LNPRASNRLAWSLFALYVLTVAATLWFVQAGVATSGDGWDVALAFGYAVVGTLVARREPANAVGWLLVATAIAYAFGILTYAYGRGSGLPGEVAVAWWANCTIYVFLYLAAMLLPLLFPTGHLLSPRWRVVLKLMLAALVLSVVGQGLNEGPLDVEAPGGIPNPLGIGSPLAPVVTGVQAVGGLLAVAGIVLGGVSLVLRWRRSRGRERQQLKVFAYVVIALLLDILVFTIGAVAGPSWGWARGLNDFAWLPGLLLFTLGVPTAVGIAILRHQLYGIDVVINRTLVYGALTVTLAVCYLGSVLALRLVLSPVTGESNLAVAGSTLAVAALFRPARARFQAVVDRRFYRQRYDASRTVDAFAGRLRDELDLEALADDLLRVTRETLHPAHASLWLRGDR
jgi:hypothetical protein